jgi:hypothetical protein
MRAFKVLFIVGLCAWCIYLANGLRDFMHQPAPQVPQPCPTGWFLDEQDTATVATCRVPSIP